ncbi:hypothetical protein ACHAPT_003820 [Fusarium lateritium]
MNKSPSTELFANRRTRDIWPSCKKRRRRRRRKENPTAALERITLKKLHKKWHRAVIQTHGFSESTSPHIKKEELKNDPVPDQLWDEHEEAMLEARWAGSTLNNELNAITQYRPNLLLLWKLSFRLFHKDPIALFTFRDSDLEFNDDSNTDCLWTETFCDKLIKIMTHPISKNPSFMLFLLKWAVICRTDDRRSLNENDTEMLDSIHCFIDPSLHHDPFGLRHEQFQQQLWETGGWPTIEAELMSMIWQKTTPHPPGLVIFEGLPYQVIASDLDTIIDALGASVGRVKLGYSVDHEALTRLTAQDHPVGSDELKVAFKKAWFTSSRDTIRHESMGGEGQYSYDTNTPALHDAGETPHYEEDTVNDNLWKDGGLEKDFK